MKTQEISSFRGSDIWIMISGLITSALTLLGVYWISQADKDWNIMGWYGLFIIPVGAIMMGIAAGSGYGLVSWLMGRKVSGGLLVAIVLLLVVAFGTAQWIQFQNLHLVDEGGKMVTFFEYYDYTTRNTSLTFGHSKDSTGALGILGYLFRFLEMAGFAAGGLLIPLALRAKPYCERCQAYMRRCREWWIPASVPERKVKKKDAAAKAALIEEMKQALDQGLASVQKLVAAVQERNSSAFQTILAGVAVDRKSSAKLTRRIQLSLNACPHCSDGVIKATMHIRQGNQSRTEKLATQTVDSGFTLSLDFRPTRKRVL